MCGLLLSHRSDIPSHLFVCVRRQWPSAVRLTWGMVWTHGAWVLFRRVLQQRSTRRYLHVTACSSKSFIMLVAGPVLSPLVGCDSPADLPAGSEAYRCERSCFGGAEQLHSLGSRGAEEDECDAGGARRQRSPLQAGMQYCAAGGVDPIKPPIGFLPIVVLGFSCFFGSEMEMLALIIYVVQNLKRRRSLPQIFSDQNANECFVMPWWGDWKAKVGVRVWIALRTANGVFSTHSSALHPPPQPAADAWSAVSVPCLPQPIIAEVLSWYGISNNDYESHLMRVQFARMVLPLSYARLPRHVS